MANQEAFRPFILRGVRVTKNELGRGSNGVVLELKYQGLKCAGKKLYRVLYESGSSHAARRFLQECQLLSQTRHPHIVQFMGVFFEKGSQFPVLVMEYLHTNLSSCLDRYGILSDEISYSILHEVSLGLTYLHGQTPVIVHRDLSANNVLLSSNMMAKISDLGVARILNLTPLQVSRMTETPGTPSYMPPEVMVADPRYDTSVDVFSFGVMMVHTFTAEWPLPKVGPTRIDPTNPDRLIPVTEAERREEFLRKIAQDHPLMDLIMRCLNNNPQRRPFAEEIVGRMGDVVLQYPPSFENRVEMLRRISTLDTEKRELEHDIGSFGLALEEKAGEVAQLREEKRELEREIVRKDSTIEEKAGEVERLSEERRQKMAKGESTIERIELGHLVETEQLESENRELRSQLEVKEVLVGELRGHNTEALVEVERQIANVNFMQRENTTKSTRITELEREAEQEKRTSAEKENKSITLTVQVESLRSQIAGLTSQAEHNKATIESKEAALTAKEIELSTLRAKIKKKAVTSAKKNDSVLITQVATLTSQAEDDRATIQSKQAALSATEAALSVQKGIIVSREADLAAKDKSLENKEATIQSLNAQLTRTREYLTSKPQPMEVELSYNHCSEAPVKMSHGTAVAINGKVYYGGGVGNNDDYDYVHCFNVSQYVWSTLPKLPVWFFGLGEILGDLVIVGGLKYSEDNGSDSSEASEQPREVHQVATTEIYVFDKASHNWKQTIPPMPTARHSPAVVSLPTHLLVAGGQVYAPYQAIDTVEIYNINASQWSKTDRLPYAYDDPKTAVCNNTIYLLGGEDGKNHLNKVVTAQADQLIANSAPADQQEDESPKNDSEHKSAWNDLANTPSYHSSAVAVSNMVLAIGGLKNEDVDEEFVPAQGIYVYSSSMDAWVYCCNLPSPRAFPATVSLSETDFLVIGGEHDEKTSTVYKCSFKPRLL